MKTEQKTGQFVCFEVKKSDISLNYPKKTGGGKEQDKFVKYVNLRLYFHGFSKPGTNTAFIIASQYFPIRNYGVKSKPYEDFYNFMSLWAGRNLDKAAFYRLSYNEIKNLCIGENALLEYETENNVTKILSIAPAPNYVYLNELVKVPDYLLPGYKKLKSKFDKLPSGDEIKEIRHSIQGLTAEKSMYGEPKNNKPITDKFEMESEILIAPVIQNMKHRAVL